MDEFTRECLALEVRRSFRAKDGLVVLAMIIALRGAPAHLRSDNGPEIVALAVQAWLKANAIGALSIAPGSPWENAYVESFNSRLRDEHLNREEFASRLEAQVMAAGWRRDYNQARPHSSLEYLAPAVFAARWRGNPETLNQNAHSTWINKRGLARTTWWEDQVTQAVTRESANPK